MTDTKIFKMRGIRETNEQWRSDFIIFVRLSNLYAVKVEMSQQCQGFKLMVELGIITENEARHALNR